MDPLPISLSYDSHTSRDSYGNGMGVGCTCLQVDCFIDFGGDKLKQCKFMILLTDFPKKNSALFGFGAY